jgi:hypothetical protein
MASANGYGMDAVGARKPSVDSGKNTKSSGDSGKPAANK